MESTFSQVKDCIWSVGKFWSEKRLLDWLYATLNKILHPEMWKELWSQCVSLNPEFQCHFSRYWSRCFFI